MFGSCHISLGWCCSRGWHPSPGSPRRFLLLVSVSLIHCQQAAFRAAGTGVPAAYRTQQCVLQGTQTAAVGGGAQLPACSASRGLSSQAAAQAAGARGKRGRPGWARTEPGGGPRGSAGRHTARHSQFLLLIGQAYFIKKKPCYL